MMQDTVLKNDWIVACRSTDLQEQPIQVMIMGERIVLFRNEEGVHAFKDLCIHRGAALSLGCVRDGKLVCPYHGWEYKSSGDCVKIPQLPADQPIPGKARAVKYGCTERYGFIWATTSRTCLPCPNMKIPPSAASSGGRRASMPNRRASSKTSSMSAISRSCTKAIWA